MKDWFPEYFNQAQALNNLFNSCHGQQDQMSQTAAQQHFNAAYRQAVAESLAAAPPLYNEVKTPNKKLLLL